MFNAVNFAYDSPANYRIQLKNFELSNYHWRSGYTPSKNESRQLYQYHSA